MPFVGLLPEALKVIVGFYMFYLIKQKDPIYLPAIVVWASPGSTISFSILISCVIVAVYNYKEYRTRIERMVLNVSLLLIPLFVWMSIVRVFEIEAGLVKTLTPLGYFLGLFPFFYGILMAKKISNASINGFIVTLCLLPLFMKLNILVETVRLFWLSYPFFLAVIIMGLMRFNSVGKRGRLLILISILFVTMFPSPKFTLLFSSIVGVAVLIYKKYRLENVFGKISWQRISVLFLLIVGYFINTGNEMIGKYKNIDLGGDTYYSSFEDFTNKLSFKAFGDRSVIWIGGWEAIKTNGSYFTVPYDITSFRYKNIDGVVQEDVSFGVHNLALELMRYYGVFIGIIISIVYFIMVSVGTLKFITKKKRFDLNVLAASCLGCGIVGALVGQFPLMITFSVGFMSLCGIFHGLNTPNLVK